MVKANLYRQNHTKKHTHTHSEKENKERKKKEKKYIKGREQPNQVESQETLKLKKRSEKSISEGDREGMLIQVRGE